MFKRIKEMSPPEVQDRLNRHLLSRQRNGYIGCSMVLAILAVGVIVIVLALTFVKG